MAASAARKSRRPTDTAPGSSASGASLAYICGYARRSARSDASEHSACAGRPHALPSCARRAGCLSSVSGGMVLRGFRSWLSLWPAGRGAAVARSGCALCRRPRGGGDARPRAQARQRVQRRVCCSARAAQLIGMPAAGSAAGTPGAPQRLRLRTDSHAAPPEHARTARALC